MSLTLITPPLTSPVSIEDARRQCRIHSSDTTYDDELRGYIAAAVAHVQSALNIGLEPQTWRLTIDAFGGDIVLPIGPVIEVDEIGYDDPDGASQTVHSVDYRLIQTGDERWRVASTSAWPAGGNVHVDFTVGYEGELDSADYMSGVPADLKQAILLLVGHWFRNRQAAEIVSSGDLVSVPLAFDALVQPYRRAILA